jgi:RNA polymerase sigma-70 factor, ECF subfamily
MVLENQIIEGCKRGKRKYFSVLYKKYAPGLLGVCCRYSKTISEAEDVLQEGFIKIFQKINTYKGKGSFEGWMRRIMINTAINNYKQNLKHYYHDEIDNDRDINIISDDVSDQKFIQVDNEVSDGQIIKLIQELPPGYQMVFNLYVIDGLTHQEVSEELNISVNTSKSQLSKARKWLRNKLAIKDKLYL